MLDASKDFQGAKGLKRDEEGNIVHSFVANGVDYFIRPPDSCITIERWTMYENLSLMYGFDRTLQTIADGIKETMDDLNAIVRGDNSKNVVEVIYKQKSILEGMKRRTEAKYSVALYICTLFIVEKDEDITKWDFNHAKTKIENWNKEGLNVKDFFYLAKTMQSDFIRVLQKQLEI